MLDTTNDLTLKGYSIQNNEKDEITPSKDKETIASKEIVNYLKAKIDSEKKREVSKTAIDFPRPSSYMVGVFKTTTCGNSPEFIYFMDCEDGGWTNIQNNKNIPFATYVDKNKNIEFHMCMVTGANYNGFALNLSPIPGSILYNNNLFIIERFHDNEDSSNKNGIKSGQQPNASGYLGGSQFAKNTLFAWVKESSNRTISLGYSYGVIAENGEIEISIDDENKKNANWARSYDYSRTTNIGPHDLPYKQWVVGFYCWENTGYKIKIN